MKNHIIATNIIEIKDLPAYLSDSQRLMGLDLGAKTIGVAISDTKKKIATSLRTLERKKLKNDVEQLCAIIEEFSIGGVIIGYPLNMDGTTGPRAQATRAFVRNISSDVVAPIVFWDERLSTVAVEKALRVFNLSLKKRKKVVDANAAAYILQGALERLAKILPTAVFSC